MRCLLSIQICSPDDYNRKDLGFIVTGLRHEVVKSDWLTTITAYVILLDQENAKKDKAGTSLTRTEKANMEGLFAEVVTATRDKYNEYCNAYLHLLYFVKTFYENDLFMKYEETVSYQDLNDPSKIYTEETKPKAFGNFTTKYTAELKRLQLDPDAHKRLFTLSDGVNKIVGEINLPYPNGNLLLNNYTFVTKGDSLSNDSRVYVLNHYLREDGRKSASIKKMVIEMVKKSSTFNTLASNPESSILADDVLKVIDKVHASASKKQSIGLVLGGSTVAPGASNSATVSETAVLIQPYYTTVDDATNRVRYEKGNSDKSNRDFIIDYSGKIKQ